MISPMEKSAPTAASRAMAVLAIVLGVFAILSSLGGALLVALGTSFFALNTRWEGDWNEVMRSGCAFAVPLLIAFVLGVVAIVGGSRKSSAHSWLALALGAIGLALVPATFIVPLVLLKATAPREELGGPSAIQYMDPNEIGRACHAGPTLNGDCTVGYSCMGGEFANPATGLFSCQIACVTTNDHCPYRTSCGPQSVCVLHGPR
jgi:vacuolar-type H+-ATPase subunit I/STV1